MNRIVITAVWMAVSVAGCERSASNFELSEAEVGLFADVGINAQSAKLIRSHGDSVERLQGLNDEWEAYDAKGVVLLTPPNEGETVLQTLRSSPDLSQYAVYLMDQGFGYGPDSIAILVNTDPWFYLETVRINGVNYDIGHDEVTRRLRKWDTTYGLQLVGAGMDWLHAEFERPPDDWASFAKEVYEFCPDVVEQGTGSVESLAFELKKMNGVYLWWD